MSQLIAVIFDSPDQAEQARAAIKQIQREGQLTLQDAATVELDSDGQLRVHNEVSRDVKWGAGLGGVFGAALTFIFPLAGLAVGAAGGALIGKLLDRGLDKKFVTEVGNALNTGIVGAGAFGRRRRLGGRARGVRPVYRQGVSDFARSRARGRVETRAEIGLPVKIAPQRHKGHKGSIILCVLCVFVVISVVFTLCEKRIRICRY